MDGDGRLCHRGAVRHVRGGVGSVRRVWVRAECAREMMPSRVTLAQDETRVDAAVAVDWRC